MKRLSCITLLGASLFMFSCGDDAPSAENPTGALPDKFSSKTVEQNKAELEDNGIKLLRSLEGLKDSKGVEVSTSLLSLFSYEDEEEVVYPGGRVLSSLAGLSTDAKSARKIFSGMRLDEDPESLQELMDSYAGTYQWSSTKEDFDTVNQDGSAIILKFPAVEGGTSNNATLTIGEYQGVDVTVDGEVVNLPKNLVMNVTVDGAKVIEYSFKATYNGSNDPTNVVTTLSIAPYVFEVNVTNTTTLVEANYSLKNGQEIVMAMGASSTGKYSIAGLESTQDSDGEFDEDMEDIFETGSAYVQLYNIKIAGDVNMKAINAGMDAIYPENHWNDTTFNEEAATVAEAKLYNENYNLIVFYVDSNEKIADTEFYKTTNTESYSYPVDRDGDGSYESEETYTHSYSYIDMRLVFADQSKSDFETYFNSGFSELEAELEKFEDSL